MPLREGAALAVLAGQPDRHRLGDQARERQRLGVAPVDPAFVDRGDAPLELLEQLRVDGEFARHLDQLRVELAQPLGGHVGIDLVLPLGLRDDLVARLRRNRLPERLLELLVRRLQARLHGLGELVDLRVGDDALGDQLLGVLGEDGGMVGDPRRHQRLRVRGLVLLVVAEAPVAEEVDDDVAAEAAAVGECEPDSAQRGGRVVGVHVDDRHVVALRDVARVERRAALGRVGRVADLVVRNQVQRPAGRIAGQVGEVQRLGDDALAGEGGVTVDEDAERLRRVVQRDRLRAVGLLGARAPLGDRVDELEVARVRHQRHADLAARRLARRAHAEVVLDVTGPALRVGGDGIDRPLALELAQDLVVRAPHHVGQHVEAAAVGHADDDLADAVGGGEVDRLVEHGHQQVEAFERELLLAEERAPQERLEALDLGEARQQAPLLVVGERPAVAAGLDRLA